MASMTDMRKQAVSGVVPPQQDEALIRMAWPSIARVPAVATLGRKLILSIVGAPLGWLLMAPLYFLKILPGLASRYTLTNRRVMIQHGMKPVMAQEVALSDIDDVRLIRDDNSDFFRAANLEIISKGVIKMTLRGIPGADTFRQAILNACMAWVPGKASRWIEFQPAKAPGGK